jgi:hypothetical protein
MAHLAAYGQVINSLALLAVGMGGAALMYKLWAGGHVVLLKCYCALYLIAHALCYL